MKLHPDFIMLGASRSGTTFLYDLLQQHPDIYLRKEKRPEPHFFALTSRYNTGIEAYYQTVFKDFAGQKSSGEASTSTLYCLDAISRIHKHNPNTKFIVLLRQPVARMISEYTRNVEMGREKLSFKEALEQEEDRRQSARDEYKMTFEPDSYRKRGHYAHFLESWFEVFDKSQFYVGLTENLIQYPYGELKKIFRFLEADEDFIPELGKTDTNSSKLKVEIPASLKAELRAYFQPQNETLERLLDIDLKPWN